MKLTPASRKAVELAFFCPHGYVKGSGACECSASQMRRLRPRWSSHYLSSAHVPDPIPEPSLPRQFKTSPPTPQTIPTASTT